MVSDTRCDIKQATWRLEGEVKKKNGVVETKEKKSNEVIRTNGEFDGETIVLNLSTDKLSDEARQGKSFIPEEVLWCTFVSRPFGFRVASEQNNMNTVVKHIGNKNLLTAGLRPGYCVYKVNKTGVLREPYKKVIRRIKGTPCPLQLGFVKLLWDQSIVFQTKPLGFSVFASGNNNVEVGRLNTRSAMKKGVKVGSQIVGVNNNLVRGWKYYDIVKTIKEATFPLVLRFSSSTLPAIDDIEIERLIFDYLEKKNRWHFF